MIKTFNTEKNDYSACLYYNENDDVIVKNKCSINSPYNKWIVNYDAANKTNKIISLHPYREDEADKKVKLINYYDENGQNINKLVKVPDTVPDTGYNWNYETPTNEDLPQTKI